MKSVGLSTIFILVTCVLVCAQIRQEKLIIGQKQQYEIIGSDIIVLDTLIVKDSAVLVLNREKVDNFIHAKYIRFGKGSRINGNGIDGIAGRSGRDGYTSDGPCKDGIAGTSGARGTAAKSGVNLYMYFDQIVIDESVLIELSGGDGGDGGKGGRGGGGSPGTRLCDGGDGGNGGNGGAGGDGGNGGNLTLSCKPCPDLRAWIGNRIVVRGYGGNEGLGGPGGLGGLAGLINSGNSEDGERGQKGKTGTDGEPGRNGAINFE